MSTELTIIKSNYVNEYRYTLNREEQKLLLYVISQIREDEGIYKKGFKIDLPAGPTGSTRAAPGRGAPSTRPSCGR